ncbi:MAG TPA: hypothetical protein PK325_04020 [Cyclobacteriaceae bacterium]|nr:hypothetical protein [Cyclobacteriaceae bacterium]HMV07347.1 hypothetical protein [Cyclobacteriaceae bacterium]HMV88825.1 hypothetical protein [Cyclobacteriaceae bacterium]HMW99298.1 hypothetical protein [Cyclobacteriaceae bacterium]HMX48913.1 hypothetical protein [Cyclobacteriaceae bacterium]
MNKVYWIAIFLLSVVTANGQEGLPAKVHIIARAEENSILLRIAPGSPALWELGNKYGYVIERFTVARDKQYLGSRERHVLTSQPLKPLPMAQWETMSLNNPFAEIAVEAIYGETFELSTDFSQDVMQMYNKAKELESRFSFALFAADISPEVSQASGLYMKDTDVRKNEKYLYRVYSTVPQTLVKSDTGFVYTSLADFAPLPEIREVNAQFSDHLAMISWSTRYAQSFYSAYWIERSEDGKTFSRTSELPFVNTYPDDKPDPGVSFKLDSLGENNKTYFYRVIGISPFGITGPPSEVVKGEGVEALGASAAIRKISDSNGQADLMWEFPKEKESAIKGFEIERSSKPDNNFKTVSRLLPSATRTFHDSKPEGTNYYRVKALGKNGAKSISFPVLFQLEDSIPPLQPTGLVGFIDTTGLVTLRWNNNREPDLSGYRVFRSNFQNSEFSQITSDPVDSAVFKEKIPLQNLSRAIYYKVQAIDTRFNPSTYSSAIKIMKPDRVRPAVPVFKSWRTEKDKIELTWSFSPSSDVTHHNLKTRSTTSAEWITTRKFISTDKPVYNYQSLKGGDYEFMLEAVDSSGNSSVSKILKATLSGTPPKSIENIKATPDRTKRQIVLSWKETVPGTQKILIYRAEGDKPVTLYKAIPGSSSQFIDSQVSMNTTYSYYLKVVLEGGAESAFSEEVKLLY